jgi:hypothetical protein
VKLPLRRSDKKIHGKEMYMKGETMRINPVILLLFSFIFSLNPSMSQTPAKEDFNQFFPRFIVEKDFQLERVQFPLTKIVLIDDPNPKGDYINKTVNVDKSEWEHISFYYTSDRRPRAQIFDNFEAKLRDTDERVFAWLGIETGYQIYYYFQRIDGKWYLIKIKDCSIL